MGTSKGQEHTHSRDGIFSLGGLTLVLVLLAAQLVPAQSDTNSVPPAEPGSEQARSGAATNTVSEPPPAVPPETPAAAPGTEASTNATPATNAPAVVRPKPIAELASFRLAPGLRIELAASENLVTAPAAMAFDEDGRLFVAEMRDYPDRREASPHLGRVRVLEASSGEGVFDRSTVYAEDLALPSAIACYGGGVYVATTPDILYLKDSRHDGIADVRRIAFTGFGSTNAVNADALINSFKWSLDNRIHGVTAGIGGSVSSPETVSAGAVSLAGFDFSFDPRDLRLSPEVGGGQSGLAFDTWGHRFVTDLARPLLYPMYAADDMARNPSFVPAPAVVDVITPGAVVYPLRTAVSATTLLGNTNSGAARMKPGPTVAAWLTRARGTAIYRSAALPAEYFHSVFIADPETHVIHRRILRENGLFFGAERSAGERNTEFLSSEDPLFRPSQIVEGPDGALYVADFRDGRSGRIYRIVAEGDKGGKVSAMGQLEPREWVAALASTNAWSRETAARLLFERRPPEAVALLGTMLANSRLAYARLGALYSIAGMGALTDAYLLRALRDAEPHVREQGVRLAGMFAARFGRSEALRAQLGAMASDPAPAVRYQLAFAIGNYDRQAKVGVLANLVRRDLRDPWMQSAILSSLSDGAGPLFIDLAGDPRMRGDAAGAAFLERLGTMIGTQGRQEEVTQALDFINRGGLDLSAAFALLGSVGDGLHRTRSSVALVDPRGDLAHFFPEALTAGLNIGAPDAVRVSALHVVGIGPDTLTQTGDALFALLTSRQSMAVQSAALSTLGVYNGVAGPLLNHLSALQPAVRAQAVSLLFLRADRLEPLLTALERGVVRRGEVSSSQVNLLRNWPDPAIRDRAVRLFGAYTPQRPLVLNRYRPAVALNGNSSRGRDLFAARCAGCHQVGGVGTRFGPDLAVARTYGKEKILASILEPGLQVAPGYETSVVEAATGEVLVGIAREMADQSLLLRQPGGVQSVWPKANVQAQRSQSWSMMPDGVETGLSVQDMADLLQFLVTAPQ